MQDDDFRTLGIAKHDAGCQRLSPEPEQGDLLSATLMYVPRRMGRRRAGRLEIFTSWSLVSGGWPVIGGRRCRHHILFRIWEAPLQAILQEGVAPEGPVPSGRCSWWPLERE